MLIRFTSCRQTAAHCQLDSCAAQPMATVAAPCCSLQTLFACRPHSRGAKSEVQGTNRDAASTLATLHSFKEWNAAQQKTAHSLAGAHTPAGSCSNDPHLWLEGKHLNQQSHSMFRTPLLPNSRAAVLRRIAEPRCTRLSLCGYLCGSTVVLRVQT